jgi:UDP-N-acetylmuramate: L-alanyl-gamma-D-glutamyl-meso-diaminopimelate ligase
MSQKVHFIAIGGSVMHNLAIALHRQGYQITGSDDEIYDPARTRLQNLGLLPAEMGWFPEKIYSELDAVILGMHARKDNPELARAQELGLPIYSYPEYIYRKSLNKQRVVIAGSHGKTTITSMILHALRVNNRQFDYLVGAQLEGFDTMVKLSDNAPLIVVEGDEYPASPTDLSPKFLHYHPHVALISGIAWDHFNVFPTWKATSSSLKNWRILCLSQAF